MNLYLVYLILQIMGISMERLQAQSMDFPHECVKSLNETITLEFDNKDLIMRLEKTEKALEDQLKSQFEDEKIFNEMEFKLQTLQVNLLQQQNDFKKNLLDDIQSFKSKMCNTPASLGKNLKDFSQVQNIIAQKINANPINDADNELDSVQPDSEYFCNNFYYSTLENLSRDINILQIVDNKLSTAIKKVIDKKTEENSAIDAVPEILKYLEQKDQGSYCVKTDDKSRICTSHAYPTSCVPFDSPHCDSNKCMIENIFFGPDPFPVTCDQELDGGGWLIIQRRINGSVDFRRDWNDYKNGFGNLDGEFWLGLDKIHALTKSLAPAELLIQLRDHDDVVKYAKFGEFYIGNETESYELKRAEDYVGNAGDSFSLHKGAKFSTKDRDNKHFCARDKYGAWWYKACLWSNLNGFYYENGVVADKDHGKGICWNGFHNYVYSLKFVQMMIRSKRSSLQDI